MREEERAKTAGPQRHSHRHEAILQWLIANPEKKLGECASEFGVTPAWLSCVLHSDTFQERLRERQDECFSTAVVGLRERLTGVAHRAVERLGEKVELVQDPNFLLKVADMAVKNLQGPRGVAASAGAMGVNIQQNNYYAMADRGTLERARRKMRGLAEAQVPDSDLDLGLEAGEGIGEGSSGLGQTRDASSHTHTPSTSPPNTVSLATFSSPRQALPHLPSSPLQASFPSTQKEGVDGKDS